LFVQPFLVIASYRLHDGSHILPSPPVLMIPNSGPFMLEIGDEDSYGNTRMNVAAAVCRLQWRMSIPPDFENPGGRISHLDILISDPLPLHNPDAQPEDFRNIVPDIFTHSQRPDGLAGEHRVTTSLFKVAKGYKPIPTAGFASALLGTTEFHCISEIPVDELAATDDFKDVDMNTGSLALIGSQPAYQPDYAHLSEIKSAGKAVFSGRTTLFDITITPPQPDALKYLSPYSNVAGYIPRFLFHPDPERRYFPLALEGKGMALPLLRHPNLHGSYRLLPLTKAAGTTGSVPLSPTDTAAQRYPAMIWRSATDNHLLFPDSLKFNLSVGRVIAICRAFRSSGLVATTSPTAYLFTTEGIYLLKESDDGSLKDAGLISRHILRDAADVIPEETGISFTDIAGRQMRIEGTKVISRAASYSSQSILTLVSNGDEAEIRTRALKFGDGERRKQLLSISFRGCLNTSSTVITLQGSDDLIHWRDISLRRGHSISGLWCATFTFFRLLLKGEFTPGESISAIAATIIV
ncbi:MAG: hypothetical protein K2G69_04275, partial [Muribaculaceae bacterium]|nr:hypothetical protein [Muribaculaceae bacterium]